uniref:Uncharacterized protein n=1 Tax=Siphoviridae sp. ct5co22 TaxID=2826294 RepID=A0A8S5QVA0_9CAUD|nr:MAG TPA: hypothetical protein [Siphoviridae sp. ct5co22]
MNAEYIYDIFEETERNQDPDLLIGLAKLQAEQPIPEGITEKELCSFIGRHYNALVDAYKGHDRAAFEETVLACEEQDAEKEAE